MKQLFVVLLILSGVALAADDYNTTAQWLQDRLKANPHDDDSFWALGYVAGVTDELGMQGIICPAPEVTYGEFMKVVIKYIDENPTTLHLHRATVVKRALMNAYPCPKYKLSNPKFLDKSPTPK